MSAARPVEVRLHPDPLRLEAELADRIGEAQRRSSPWSRILVLAPTARWVARLRVSLAERRGALLGVDVLHYQALARELAAGPTAPRLASPQLLEALVDLAVAQTAGLPLAEYAAGRPAVAAELRARLSELREAGIRPADLGAAAEAGEIRDLAALFERYASLLDALERDTGCTDRTGLVRRATRAASSLPPYRAIFAYGAYEIVGMNLDLLRSLPALEPLTVLVPADPDRRAYRHARRTLLRLFPSEPVGLDDGETGARPFVRAARSLWERERPPATLPRSRIHLVHAQGPEAELNVAARRALHLVARGVPPEAIGIVARSLEPYAGAAESVFSRHGLAVDSSARYPLARHPLARTLLLLLDVWKSDYGRREVIELARSPHLGPDPAGRDGPRWRPDEWDRWSRTFGIVRGVDAWTEDLPALVRSQDPPPWDRGDPEASSRFAARAEEDAASAETLGATVAAWRREWVDLSRRGETREAVASLRGLPSRWIRGWGDPAIEGAREVATAWENILEELPLLERAGGTLPSESALSFTSRALREIALPSAERGGVAFLDVMQARGQVFRHLIVIGFNEGLLPRRVRENPSLPDAVRERLRARTGLPLALRAEGREEEWLLFAGLLASARKSLTITWQRADADGKALGPSLYLRELVRVLPGSPSITEVVQGTGATAPRAVPTHPARAAAWLLERTGLLTREEGALLVAARSRGKEPEAVRGLVAALDPDRGELLEAGFRLIEATERYAASQLPYDAVLDADPGWTQAFSATSLERLAGCPLRFFFRDVLGVRPLDEEDRELHLDTRELGRRVHGILERVFQELGERKLLDPSAPVETALAAATAVVDAGWSDAFAPVARRLGSRFPVLFRSVEAIWRSEIDAFLASDIRRLRDKGHRPTALEAIWEGTVPLVASGPGGASSAPVERLPGISLRGIPDRVTRDGEGRLLVSDYKTGGRLESWVKPEEILSARKAQLPLYVLLAGARGESDRGIEAEFLGLGPAFLPDRGAARSGPVALGPETLEETREGLLETLAVLRDLVRGGRFPFRPDRQCEWCDFRRACRRRHHASRRRVESHPLLRPYFRTQQKTKPCPLIADVRDTEGDDG